jgi:hypothetical protein
MRKKILHTVMLLITGAAILPIYAQAPENIKFGLYGRTEQNIYRYYNGLSRGNFSTQRVSNGYSAGVLIHSSINYLFNAGMSFGLSEASYAPNIKYDNNNILWNLSLRLWQFNAWGELKLGQDENQGVRFLLGGEWMYKEYKKENWSLGVEGNTTWPQLRFMPRVGLSYEYPLKKKWVITPNTGVRIAFNNRLGYDYGLSQFWAGLNIAYKVYNR